MNNSDILLFKIVERNNKIQKLQQEVRLLSTTLVAEEKLKQLEE